MDIKGLEIRKNHLGGISYWKDGILVGFREWQDLGGSSERNSRNLMHLFGL